MLTKNMFRLAITLSNSQAGKFSSNLYKLVKLSLLDCFPNRVTVHDIRVNIEENYSLVFSDDEIISSIESKGQSILKYEQDEDPLYTKYCFSPEEYQKEKENLKETENIDSFITQFIDIQNQNNEESLDFDTTKDLIYRFLYFTFNSDTQTVLELIDKSRVTDQTEYAVDESFSPDQAKIINDFLNWDYNKKNIFILNLISACFEYCMLTVKKDTSSYVSVFNGKRFYLDSNVIFRLAGFNKKERQYTIDAFIKKCTDAGIQFYYTNHTKQELENSISFHVGLLHGALKAKEPIAPRAEEIMSSKYANLSFYEEYFDWCKNPGNIAGDFEAFKDYLVKKVRKIIAPFKPEIADNYETVDYERFDLMTKSFKQYKYENDRNAHDSSIKIDINNYFHILKINNEKQGINFLDIKNYFITADHSFTEWARKQRPGTVPVFVLPSVWYSILLKYKGRTDNDYAAFCQFLNIRIAPEKDPRLSEKNIMLAHIMELDEPTRIKEEIIYDIQKRLEKMDESSIENPIEFAEESHRYVVTREVEEATKKAEEKCNAESEFKINSLKEQYEKQNLSDKETSRQEGFDEGQAKGYADGEKHGFDKGQLDIIKKEAAAKAKRNKRIQVVSIILFILGCVVLIGTLIIMIIPSGKDDSEIIKWINNNDGVLTVISILFSALFGAIATLTKVTTVLSTDKERIMDDMKEKHSIQD